VCKDLNLSHSPTRDTEKGKAWTRMSTHDGPFSRGEWPLHAAYAPTRFYSRKREFWLEPYHGLLIFSKRLRVLLRRSLRWNPRVWINKILVFSFKSLAAPESGEKWMENFMTDPWEQRQNAELTPQRSLTAQVFRKGSWSSPAHGFVERMTSST
jgi:hypothetical protein